MRTWIGVLVTGVAVAGCGKPQEGGSGGEAPAVQSLRDGIELICRAGVESGAATANPAERAAVISRWVAPKLTNAEARALFAGLGDAPGLAPLRAAAREVGLDRCELIAAAQLPEDPWGELAVPPVGDDVVVDEVPREGPLVTITAAGVSAGGAAVPDLAAWLTPQAGDGPGAARLAVAPDAPASALLTAIAALEPVAARSTLVVRRRGEAGAIPLPRPAGADEPAATTMVLELTDRATLWSMSGDAGTRIEPLVDVPRDAEGAWLVRARAALAELARAAGTPRGLVVMATDPRLTAGDVIVAIATVRADARGPIVEVRVGVPGGAASGGRAARAAVLDAYEEDAARFADVLMLEGDDDEPGLMGEMRARAPGSDLAAQIAEVRGEADTIQPGTRRGSVEPAPPAARVAVASHEATAETSLTSQHVVTKVQSAYMAGLKRCYRSELASDPALAGTLELRLDVAPTGRVAAVTATGVNAAVASCIEAKARSWRFPIPKKEDAPADASFRIALSLTPQ